MSIIDVAKFEWLGFEEPPQTMIMNSYLVIIKSLQTNAMICKRIFHRIEYSIEIFPKLKMLSTIPYFSISAQVNYRILINTLKG